MSEADLTTTGCRELAQLLALKEDSGEAWEPDDLAAMLRHQLESPMVRDLAALPGVGVRRLKDAMAGQGTALESFADLFRHPRPPLELLRLTKRFAKAHHDTAETGLPAQITLMLYYASIVTALVRCRCQISILSVVEMAQGFAWARDQRWVDTWMRTLFQEGLDVLKQDHPAASQPLPE